MRIDKFIWAIRLYKTRSAANTACLKNNVKFYGEFAKPSKPISVGDSISIKVTPIWRSYTILSIPKSRVGAKLLEDLIEETTSIEALDELKLAVETKRLMYNQSNKGRPSKRDRRKLNDFKS